MKIFQFFGVVALVAALGFAILTFIVFSEIRDFQNKFVHEDKLFLLDINGNIRSAFIVGEFGSSDEPFEPVSQEELYDLTNYYIQEDFDRILGGRYKVFIYDEEAVSEYNAVDLHKKHLSTAKVIELLKSASILDDFESEVGFSYTEFEGVTDEGSLRYYLFARMVFTPLEKEGPLYVIDHIKNEKIRMYPHELTFTLLKLIPQTMIKTFITQETIDKVRASAK